MNIAKTLKLAIILIAALATQVDAVEIDPNREVTTGDEVLALWNQRHRGYGDSKAGMVFTLISAQGERSQLKTTLRTLEYHGEDAGEKALITIHSPAAYEGIGLLIHSHIRSSDDIWLYMPSVKRTKRIATENKSGPFVGSEFAYEDIGNQELHKFTYKLLRKEDYNSISCHVVEQYPTYPHSGYIKQIVWYAVDNSQQQKIEYYDRKGELLKTLVFHGYQKYLNRYWRPDTMEMENHQTGKGTRIDVTNWQFNKKFSDADFESERLQQRSR